MCTGSSNVSLLAPLSHCLSDLARQASLMASPGDPVLTVFCPGLPLLLAGSGQCGCPLSTPPLTCSGDPHREAQACPHPVGRAGGGQESKDVTSSRRNGGCLSTTSSLHCCLSFSIVNCGSQEQSLHVHVQTKSKKKQKQKQKTQNP